MFIIFYYQISLVTFPSRIILEEKLSNEFQFQENNLNRTIPDQNETKCKLMYADMFIFRAGLK